MKSAQDYREKAARAEALADDPHQNAGIRAELRSIARCWRRWAEQTDWLALQSGTGEACAARQQKPDEQIVSHIRAVLSRLKSRSSSGG